MPGLSRKYNNVQLGSTEIERYMRKRDIPEWFRGISRVQCSASSNLFEALLYDGEQRSTHRVMSCLESLGLRPSVTKEQVKYLMKTSRGNDLAFLWFLMEAYYKSEGPGYTINEQILYSCIAHLDMVTTLRELDRLLPQNPSKEITVPKKQKQTIVIKPTNFKHFQLTRYSYSPYLEEIITPISHHPSFNSKRPNHKVSLHEYDVYKDPTYTVRNEANRWFADYKPKLSKRIAGYILKELIEKILDNSDEIAKELENKLVACEKHRCLIEAENKRQRDIREKARSDIKKYFDVDGRRDRSTTDRIMAQIERDVEMYMQKSRFDAERIHLDQDNKMQKIEVLEGIDTIRYCEPNNSDDQCSRHCIWSTTYTPNVRKSGREDQLKSDDQNQNRKSSDCLFQKASMPSFCDILRNSKDYDCFFRGLCEPAAATNQNSLDEGDQLFFIGNQEHQPWRFDYQKIFTVEHSAPTAEQSIKLSFAKALTNDISFKPDIHGNVDVANAADKGFKTQWSESVESYNNRRVHIEPPPEIKKPMEEEEIPIRFDREYFDPNDKKYMVYMLKCCFDRMKKNPKFVLASMPDAHKIPSLLYFIQDRYGKRYSFEERQDLFAESLRVLRALEKLTKVAPLPTVTDFSTNPKVSYACRGYILAKSEKVRQNYYDELDQVIMNKARIFWFSMRPYLFSSGPPRNTYFAYMPPRTGDLTRFQQWKPSEFMDAKKEWDRRQRENKRFKRR